MYIIADRNLTSFSFETFHFNAGDGRHGSSKNLTGRTGDDVYIKVPCGTLISELLPDDLYDYMASSARFYSLTFFLVIIKTLYLNTNVRKNRK